MMHFAKVHDWKRDTVSVLKDPTLIQFWKKWTEHFYVERGGKKKGKGYGITLYSPYRRC